MLSFYQLTSNVQQKSLFYNINITYLPSSIIWLQGTNGAGKTSLLKMIAGIMNAYSGNIFYKHASISSLSKPYCTYIGHDLGLKAEMSVFDNLKFWSKVYNSLETLDASIHYFKLYELLEEKCHKLSRGLKQLVALARLIACQSDLWLLDEADSHLSKENKDLLNNLIAMKANSGGIVLFTSHTTTNFKSPQILDLADYT